MVKFDWPDPPGIWAFWPEYQTGIEDAVNELDRSNFQSCECLDGESSVTAALAHSFEVVLWLNRRMNYYRIQYMNYKDELEENGEF